MAGIQTVVYPVKNIDAAKALFVALLGVEPSQDTPYYVGFEVDGQAIGLNPNGHAQGMTGPVPYWKVSDLDARIDALTAAGATVQQAATDVGGGRRIATLLDADGNPIGLMQDA